MTAVQDQIDALVAKVHAENTIIGSAMALITGLKTQLAAAAAAQVATPSATVDFTALSDAIDAGAAQLAAAVVANTPAAPAVTVTVTPAAVPVTVTVASTVASS